MARQWIAMLLLVAMVSGCATATGGRQFRDDNVAQLRAGMSINQVVDMLGKPWQVTTLANGRQLYNWFFTRSTAWTGLIGTNIDLKTRQAVLVFERGRLLEIQRLVNVQPPDRLNDQPAQTVRNTAKSDGPSVLSNLRYQAPSGDDKARQLYELQQQQSSLSYEEYHRRYQEIMDGYGR